MEKSSLKKPKRVIIGLIIIFGIMVGILKLTKIPQYDNNSSEGKLYFVNQVIDGDTIKISGDTFVRFIGIDAPEKEECYYEEAKNALTSLIEGKYVRLEKDISETDKYGRLLRYVFLPPRDILKGDLFINEYMVRHGYAYPFFQSPDYRHKDKFISSQEYASRYNFGFWWACSAKKRLRW